MIVPDHPSSHVLHGGGHKGLCTCDTPKKAGWAKTYEAQIMILCATGSVHCYICSRDTQITIVVHLPCLSGHKEWQHYSTHVL